MNTLILDFLNSYADNPNPQYAVMLKGKWGCGKPHLIKQWKKRFDETADTDEEITLKPIYISTYGLDSVNDIKTTNLIPQHWIHCRYYKWKTTV